MTDKKAIVLLNTIGFMLKDMANYAEYMEALDVAKRAIRKQAGDNV